MEHKACVSLVLRCLSVIIIVMQILSFCIFNFVQDNQVCLLISQMDYQHYSLNSSF